MTQPIDLGKAIRNIQENIEKEGYTKRNLMDQYLILHQEYIKMEAELAYPTRGNEAIESILNTLYELIVLCYQLKINFYELYKQAEKMEEFYYIEEYFPIALGTNIYCYLNKGYAKRKIKHSLLDFIFEIILETNGLNYKFEQERKQKEANYGNPD